MFNKKKNKFTDDYLNILAQAVSSSIAMTDLSINLIPIAGEGYKTSTVAWERDLLEVGVVRPTENIAFEIPPGILVDGWLVRDKYGNVLERGKIDPVEFPDGGQYLLIASKTGIRYEN